MLSKQQKLKYGELLRQQMKEKEQKKKFEDSQKRGNNRPIVQNRQQPIYKPSVIQKENSYQRPYVDPKQELQKKLQGQDYNYFGGLGGGAPNRRNPEQNQNNTRNLSQPTNMRMPVDQMMQYSGNNQYHNDHQRQAPQQRLRTNNQDPNFYAQNSYNQQQFQQESISPQSYPRQSPQNMQYQEMMGRNSNNNSYNQQQNQPNYPGSYNNFSNGQRQQGRQPVSYEYIPEKQINSRIQEYSNPYQQQPNQSYQPSSINQTNKAPSYQFPPQTIPIANNSFRQQTQPQYPPVEQASYQRQNQQLQQVYRKGGRNLLKLQNQTIDEHLIKQKRKQQIQKQLKQQIQEADRKKKQDKQRLKRQEEEDQRKHLAYLAEQKRKVDQEERKKKDQRQKIIDDNVRNLQNKKRMEEDAKKKAAQDQRDRADRENKNKQMQRQRQQQEKQTQARKNQPQQYANQDSREIVKHSHRINDDDNTSVISSQTSDLEKGFSAAVSKQFFQKQRQRKNPSMTNQNHKLQKVTNQIQKMSHQINQQRQMFDRQIQRVKDQASKANVDKKKAEQEIDRLKRQLKRKMDEDNQKLLRALQSNDYKNNEFMKLPQQHYQNQGRNLNQYNHDDREQKVYPSFNKNNKPMRQKQSQNLQKREYNPEPRKYQPKEEDYNQFEQSNVGLISLDGDSKKIPLFLQHGDKLTMSQVQNFAKDSAFFQKGGLNGMKNSPPKNQKYNNLIQQSIVQQVDQDRDYANNNSRKSNRNNKPIKKQSSLHKAQKDELDRLIDSRAKSRGGWGEMSSVNSDITKQIEQLLRKKDNPTIGGISNNGRPSSISNAGKQSLASNKGYAYDGLTLNSNVGGIGTLNTNGGTLDLERINGRNDARLRELKNLGVETINTNGDDDLNALDQLLNKYK